MPYIAKNYFPVALLNMAQLQADMGKEYVHKQTLGCKEECFSQTGSDGKLKH